MSSIESDILDFRSLEAFLAAMSTGSMTAAARKLGRSQPGVTRQIRELEDALGFALFHRNGPRISPTERGIHFHEEAERLVAGMRQIRRRANAIRQFRPPSLDLAATATMAGGLVGPALALLGDERPDAINTITASAEQVVRSVRARTADIGISSFPLDYAGLNVQVVCESDCVAVLPADHALSEALELDISVLKSHRLVTVGNAFRLRSTIDMVLEQAGISTVQDYSTNTSLNAVMAARAGLGVGIVDPVTGFGIPVAGTKVLPLSVKIPYFWGLFGDRERIVSPLMQHFVKAFEQTCADVVPGCIFHEPESLSGGLQSA